MKLIKNILVAIDFTESSENVLKNAINFAKTFKSKVTIVHVLPDDINNEKVSLLVEKAATTKLKEVTDRLTAEGVEVAPSILEHGNYSDKIINASDQLHANLIIVGSGNKLKDDAFQLGSNAEKIIRKSNAPVFVVKSDQIVDVKSILCPVDFSKESSRALHSAIIMSRMFNAKLVIMSVYSTFSQTFSNLDPSEINQLRHLELKETFNSFLKGFNLIDLDVEKQIAGGNPSEIILNAIEKNNSDLLIMGTTGRSGISKILMGSVTEKVVRKVPCSFITLKNEDVVALDLESKIQDIENHYALAQQLFEKGFFKEAIHQYIICLNINVMHMPSLKGVAEVYKKLGDVDNEKKYKDMANNVLKRIDNIRIEEEIRSQRKR
ncbi:universal stress protein [Mariniflexile ostreae]|uniref:Universal stress protein n=1 Tax=Mariniflexile ostreae TaxID=1520892 RepID=A0ABV5FFD0_9FLAO